MKQNEILLWVIYDIRDDRSRGLVAKYCKEAGLYRVQKSVFLGTLERNRLDELSLQVEDIIDEGNDSVYLLPTRVGDLKKATLLGQAFDESLVTDEVHALFL